MRGQWPHGLLRYHKLGAARCSLERVLRLATKVTVTGSALVLLYFLWRSLAWPLIHDAAIMHYIAWLISQGAVPLSCLSI